MNMMAPANNRFAVGYAFVGSSTYKHYWTQLLGHDSGAAHEECYLGGSGSGDDGDQTSPGTTTVAPPTTTEEEAPPTCQDSNTDCSWWATHGLCENRRYAAWMRMNCKQSCQACS